MKRVVLGKQLTERKKLIRSRKITLRKTKGVLRVWWWVVGWRGEENNNLIRFPAKICLL